MHVLKLKCIIGALHRIYCRELLQLQRVISTVLPVLAVRGDASSDFKHMQACALATNQSDGSEEEGHVSAVVGHRFHLAHVRGVMQWPKCDWLCVCVCGPAINWQLFQNGTLYSEQ